MSLIVLRSPSVTTGNVIPGTSARAPVCGGELLPLVQPLLQILERPEAHGRMELRHPGVQADEPAVVVAGLP